MKIIDVLGNQSKVFEPSLPFGERLMPGIRHEV